MTAIEYGGGPTVEHRKEFCNLRPGSHIPGYMGYCPQFKFHHGSTYGKQTSKIASILPYYKGPYSPSEIHIYPRIGDGKISKTPKVFKDEVPRVKIPKCAGDNKYMENMIPGYSGDVPHMLYKFGGTYTNLCSECVDDFVTEYDKRKQAEIELKEKSGLFPKLKPILDDPSSRNHMNLWVDDLIKKNSTKTNERGPTEPPIPGYTGYIPKAEPTNLALGQRFYAGAQQCLEVFRTETKNHFDRLKYPVEPLKPKPERLGAPPISYEDNPHSWRIFRNTGTIPQYTGHVHELEFSSGRTVGDATRKLEVCSHHYPSYGLYTRNRDLT